MQRIPDLNNPQPSETTAAPRVRLHRVVAWVLLGAAGCCMVFLPSQMRGFVMKTHIGTVSSHGMGLASSLSPETGFAMYQMALKTSDGNISYTPYNPFPAAPFALIRAAMFFGGSNLSRQIAAARTLMHLFMFGAMITAFLTLRMILENDIAVAAAALLAFSTYYANFYNDLIFNDIPALFGCLLVCHGVVLFWKQGRYRQLVIKSLLAVSLGWQVFGALTAFALVSVCRRWSRVSITKAALSRTTRVLLFAALLGAAIIAINILNERRLVGGPISQLKTVVDSFAQRSGVKDPQLRADVTAWRPFNQLQLYRIGRAVTPYAIVKTHGHEGKRQNQDLASSGIESFLSLRIVGASAVVACLVLIVLSPGRRSLAVLALAGPAWVYPLRYFSGPHDYQSLFYIGISLVLFSTLIARIPRHRTIPLMVVATIAAVIFGMSHTTMNQWKAKRSEHANANTADFQSIVDSIPPGSTVFIARRYRQLSRHYFELPFYLRGRDLTVIDSQGDHLVEWGRVTAWKLLTPHNKYIFAYRRPDSPRGRRQEIPSIR